jgi:hypothetical protein
MPVQELAPVCAKEVLLILGKVEVRANTMDQENRIEANARAPISAVMSYCSFVIVYAGTGYNQVITSK